MNKIIIDKENNIEIKDNAIDLIIKVPKLTINIKGKVLINEIKYNEEEQLELTINIEDNSSLLYNRFTKNNITNNNIKIIQNNNSTIVLNYSFVALNKTTINIESVLTGNNNKTEIKVKGVTEELGSAKIISTAEAKKNIKDNDLLESLKVLILNEQESTIIPNLLVSSNDVIVNHAATISNIDKDYLFYLNSKGIDDIEAIKLIKNGYLLNNLDINDNQKEIIKNIIDGGE